jgi:ubiquinone/menaquinone biosynthesis C-methylase UbiE
MLDRVKRAVFAEHNSSREYLAEWAAQAARRGDDKTFRVLDAGAGIAPYRHLFDHVKYEAADFAQVDKEYAQLDYVCDMTSIPVEDETFDLVFSSQVFEHLPEPIVALKEYRRILKPGGEAWVSAPLFYEEHEQPYDFHRYTQFAWRRMADEAGMEIRELEWLEGYYGTLAHQMYYAARNLPAKHAALRAVYLVMSWRFASLDRRHKLTDRGMCKNYRAIFVRPLDA